MANSIVIVFGGTSSERFVSVASAQNVSRCIPEAERWFIAESGGVHLVASDELAAHTDAFLKPFRPGTTPAFDSLVHALDSAAAIGRTFFLALHGGEGEDGTVQRLLETRGLPFTGSDSAASARAFDKAQTKSLAAAQGARVAEARVLAPMDALKTEHVLEELFEAQGRWVLKPVADGSSQGLLHLRARSDIRPSAEALARSRVPYLAEVFIEGRELTVGVVDGPTGPRALPVSEVRLLPGAAFDYEGKYLGRGTEEVTPALLSEEEHRAAAALALLTHRAVGCAGYSRTDMILTSSGPVLLEINTLPGLTKASFIPQQLAAEGTDLRAFLLGQVELAQARAHVSSS